MEALFEWRDRNMDNTRKEVGEIMDRLAVIFDGWFDNEEQRGLL